MTDPQAQPASPPRPIEETIRSIVRLHEEHRRNATLLERGIDRVIGGLSRPRSIGALSAMAFGWVGFNLLGGRLGYHAIDPPPFQLLCDVASVASLYLVVLILASQRREDRLAEVREQMILELTILSEQKIAKVIQLLEEFRRDDPLVHNRVDHEAEELAERADPQSVFAAIKISQAAVVEETISAKSAND